ncbi:MULTISPECIES: hypothetical protein [Moorena]|uniref:Uncharacterized protein n=1 Tax=Moorena producens 3L TaxID=489825 RepID=F4Y3D2_9CYAN|nr:MULTISPECIES: hypothetical protein [Moorena]EGJ28608.1 hypothetical protein LYNGBM3L_72230 [Moorena producens 3L]NEP33958.1 hypothetical protein [Moorena sp. SIO3B2]NEQ05571.1 hypothetical protein [Moorena sp. SIO4E2]
MAGQLTPDQKYSWLLYVADADLRVGLASYGSRAIIHQSGSEFRVVGFRLS